MTLSELSRIFSLILSSLVALLALSRKKKSKVLTCTSKALAEQTPIFPLFSSLSLPLLGMRQPPWGQWATTEDAKSVSPLGPLP